MRNECNTCGNAQDNCCCWDDDEDEVSDGVAEEWED